MFTTDQRPLVGGEPDWGSAVWAGLAARSLGQPSVLEDGSAQNGAAAQVVAGLVDLLQAVASRDKAIEREFAFLGLMGMCTGGDGAGTTRPGTRHRQDAGTHVPQFPQKRQPGMREPRTRNGKPGAKWTTQSGLGPGHDAEGAVPPIAGPTTARPRSRCRTAPSFCRSTSPVASRAPDDGWSGWCSA
jgi:hypothetical protein